MGQSIVFGVIASSALLIGAGIGSAWDPPRWVTGGLLAFASGALISALAFELFDEAYELGGATRAGFALLAGATVFVLADAWLDRRASGGSEAGENAPSGGKVGLALLAAVTLDGVPENTALGVSLVEEASLALLLAIFFSNLPESLVGAAAMRKGGYSVRATMTMWLICAVVLALAVVVGRSALEGADDTTLAALLAFAGGAVLASLADTVMPEAFRDGGSWVAFATSAGFFAAFLLAH